MHKVMKADDGQHWLSSGIHAVQRPYEPACTVGVVGVEPTTPRL